MLLGLARKNPTKIKILKGFSYKKKKKVIKDFMQLKFVKCSLKDPEISNFYPVLLNWQHFAKIILRKTGHRDLKTVSFKVLNLTDVLTKPFTRSTFFYIPPINPAIGLNIEDLWKLQNVPLLFWAVIDMIIKQLL